MWNSNFYCIILLYERSTEMQLFLNAGIACISVGKLGMQILYCTLYINYCLWTIQILECSRSYWVCIGLNWMLWHSAVLCCVSDLRWAWGERGDPGPIVPQQQHNSHQPLQTSSESSACVSGFVHAMPHLKVFLSNHTFTLLKYISCVVVVQVRGFFAFFITVRCKVVPMLN